MPINACLCITYKPERNANILFSIAKVLAFAKMKPQSRGYKLEPHGRYIGRYIIKGYMDSCVHINANDLDVCSKNIVRFAETHHQCEQLAILLASLCTRVETKCTFCALAL